MEMRIIHTDDTTSTSTITIQLTNNITNCNELTDFKMLREQRKERPKHKHKHKCKSKNNFQYERMKKTDFFFF